MDAAHNTDLISNPAYDLNTEYNVIEGGYKYEGLPYCATYGIKATCIDSNGNPVIRTLKDISTYKDDVEKLIRILTENRVSIFHFEDIVEDWIG